MPATCGLFVGRGMSTTKYRQRAAFDALRAAPAGLNRLQLADRLGGDARAMGKLLGSLVRRGCVTRTGSNGNRLFHAVPGAKLPKDQRGTTAGSREALRLGWRPTQATMANLNNNAGVPRPKPVTALEQCWGWVAPISAIAESITE